jgi:diguanylate cyclase (GGDEF)-like protein/PAS domain S-box-containing protein
MDRWISSVARTAGYSVTISDAERRLVWVNDSFTRLTGYTHDEIFKKKFSDVLFFEGTDRQTVRRVHEAFAAARAVRFDLLVRAKDGRERWLDTDAQPLFDAGGALEGWVCIQADVTAQMSAREAARAAERRFGTLLDAAPEAIIGFSDDGTIKLTNARVPKLFGYSAAELDGSPIALLIPQLLSANPVALSNQGLEHTRRGLLSNDMAFFARRKDGRTLPVEISLSRIELDSGNVVLCIVRDVSEQTLAEEHARGLTHMLAQERQRLSAIIKGTETVTWELDLTADQVLVNEQFAIMIGADYGAVATMSREKWRALIHPDDLPVMQQSLVKASATADVDLVDEYRVQHASGDWIWVRSHGKAIALDEQGHPVRFGGLLRDVSAQKRVELSLVASERKFRSLFDRSAVAFGMTDRSTGRFLEANAGLVDCTGYSRDELLQMTFWDLTAANGIAATAAELEKMKLTQRYGPFEKEYRRKDGSIVPVLVSGVPLVDDRGRAVMWTVIQDISTLKNMEAELIRAARQDKLTGLANRAQFMQRLQVSLDRAHSGPQQWFAVLLVDFDRFKIVNDTLGHSAGDELLRQIAGRLRSTLRPADTPCDTGTGDLVARMGGDEFLILVNDLNSPDDACRTADRLLQMLAAVYNIGDREVHSTASIGIVTSDRCQAKAEEVVRNADVAMYEAKRAGRARYVVFDEAMHARLARHAMIESDLRQAIGTTDLFLHFQPIVDLNSGRMVSAEALLRWQHPTYGCISPAEFIPIAEESGLITAVGEWVLKQACQAMLGWLRQDPLRAPKTVSINVSRTELSLGTRLIQRLRDTLEEAGLSPQCLQLEITEREVMRNPEAALETLSALRGFGFRLAMDDFGTGTSSLGCLREYPFDTIKIDRTFLKDLTMNRDVLAVIHATLTLIANLGMAGVAEGVEEPSQLAILQSLGCQYGQGYLFSRPVPAEELLEALEVRSEARIAVNA